MGQIYDDAQEVYRPFVIDGVPASGPNDPSKTDIIGLFKVIDGLVGGAISGAAPYDTAAHLPASTGSGKIYLVTSDPTPENNGYWQDQGPDNVILSDLNDALKGQDGLLSPASTPQLDAGTDNTVTVTPAGLTHLGLTPAMVADAQAVAASLSEWQAPAQTIVTGYYIDKDTGAPHVLANYGYVIELVSNDQVEARATSFILGAVNALAVFYSSTDGSSGYLGYQDAAPTSEPGKQYTNEPLILPPGTRSIAICGRTDQGEPIQLQVKAPATDVIDRLATAEEDAATANDGVSAINASLAEWQVPDQTPVNNFYIQYTDGTAHAQNNYQYVTVAVASDQAEADATAYVQGEVNALAVFKDANGAYLGYQDQPGSTATQYTNRPLTLPPGTRSITVCGRSDAGHTVRIRVKLPATDIAARLEAVESKGSGLGTTDLCMFGDSQTQSKGGASDTGYAYYLEQLYPSRTGYDQGISGQQIEHIAARMDARPVTLTAAVTIPTSGSATFAASTLSTHLLSLAAAADVTIKLILAGVECALRYNYTSALYRLTPIDYPAQAITAPIGAVMKVTHGFVWGTDPNGCVPLKTLLGGVVVVRAGQNNLNGGLVNYSLDGGLSLTDAMVASARRYTDKIIVIGQMLGYAELPTSQGGQRTTDEQSWAILAGKTAWNRALAGRYGDWFFDVQAYHVAHGGGETKTISPNGISYSYTVLTTTAATPVLRDGIHENTTAGLPQCAAGLSAMMTARAI